jgi:uncharacterized membrane protein
MTKSPALTERLRRAALWALCLFFVVAGINHFVNPDFYLAMMPPWVPLHREAVWLSGVLEVAGGLAVLAPRARAMAGWALVALLVAIFPANLHMAVNPELYPDFGATVLWARLPFQALFIAWAWWATRPGPAD